MKSTATETFTLATGLLTIGGTYLPLAPLDLSKMGKFTKTANAAEQLAVNTAVLVATASTKSGFRVIQYVGPGNGDRGSDTVIVDFFDTSLAGDGTGTGIADRYVAAVNANAKLHVAATSSGATNLVITAEAGYPIVFVKETIPSAVITSWTLSTAGILRKGSGVDLVAAGVPGAEADKSYIQYKSTIQVVGQPDSFSQKHTTTEDFVLWVESALTVTDLDAILNGSYIDASTTTTLGDTLDDYLSKLA